LRTGIKWRGTILRIIVAAIIALFTAAPALYLACGAAVSAVAGTLDLSPFALRLFLRTVALETGAALLSAMLGLFVAIGIWTFFEKKAGKIAVALLLLYIIPSFIHLQSWIFFMDKMNALIAGFLPFSPNFTGYPAVILTTAISGLPITAGLLLVALLSVPAELVDLCRLEAVGAKAFLRVYMPYLVPSLAIGGFLIFFLNVNDFAIPSLFGVNVYALELYSRYSAGLDINGIFILSMPLILLCSALAALFGLYLSKSGFSLSTNYGKNPFKKEGFLRVPAYAGMVILAFFITVPIASLAFEAFSAGEILKTLKNSLPELTYSLQISALSAVLCFLPSLIFACLFYRSGRRVMLIAMASAPFVIAAPIAGLALIRMYNTPLLGFIYRSPVMPSIGMLSRFSFIGMLMLSSALMRLDPAYSDVLRVYNPGPVRAVICLTRFVYKECISSILIIFALAMGEFGMTLVITPPGYQSLSNKIYNYLHYGASGTIAVLCLFMLIIILLAAVISYSVLTGKKNEKDNYQD
jgi:iron(III) transport system permease protein